MARRHFDKCFAHGHKKDCRPGRPLCRWQRRIRPQRRKCECGGYHFPHRHGSGCCVHNPAHERLQWERNTGTSWETGEAL